MATPAEVTVCHARRIWDLLLAANRAGFLSEYSRSALFLRAFQRGTVKCKCHVSEPVSSAFPHTGIISTVSLVFTVDGDNAGYSVARFPPVINSAVRLKCAR